MRLLMCPPDYYGIEYEINPWMNRQRPTDSARAHLQWESLHRILGEQFGAEVELLEAQPNLPDMVFTANAGLVFNNDFIVSNFRHKERQPESAVYESWFRQRGYRVHRLPQDYCFEGEGDLLRCGKLWFAGYHFRSDIRSHQKVAEIIEQEILSLELVNDWFYHLDTCFCPLGDGKALYCPDAFDSYAQKVLENHIAQLIAVEPSDGQRFACNALVHGEKIVMNAGCDATRHQLEELGMHVYETPLDEFIKAGGSAKCLILRLD